MTDFATLLSSLAGAPSLPGARCRGRGHLFDEQAAGEHHTTAAARHRQARGLCDRCPALHACAAWVDSLPARQRPAGVVAGRGGVPDASL
ncbi:hypothetical protein [Mycolicibacterium grossiae]|uniref:hypothetical protein n=1 Tax=Mycolicibacterium grossiae TaxID=1552759 RepID=UPI0009F20A09|nr:hypothetical protein [Mycolicibacterium grossiae]QEM46301.1 hypothetical protein FZ046_17360 [Mycolicibacterium grossiae]